MVKLRHGGVFSVELIDNRPGILSFKAFGKGSIDFFQNEVGGHRFQRIPPTEKGGRVHTSTITVAAFSSEMRNSIKIEIKEEDLDYKFCRGSGKGGQNRNKLSTCCQLTHIPTGIMVRAERQRTQGQNKEEALKLLREKLEGDINNDAQKSLSNLVKTQVGSGMRGDKRRTIQCQNDIVVDHISGKQWNVKEYFKGKW